MPILINEVVSEFESPQTGQTTQNESQSASVSNTSDNTLRKILEQQQIIISRKQRLQVD